MQQPWAVHNITVAAAGFLARFSATVRCQLRPPSATPGSRVPHSRTTHPETGGGTPACAGHTTGMRVQLAPGSRKVTGPHTWRVAQCQVRASVMTRDCPAANTHNSTHLQRVHVHDGCKLPGNCGQRGAASSIAHVMAVHASARQRSYQSGTQRAAAV